MFKVCSLPFDRLTFRAAAERRRDSLKSFRCCKANVTWTTVSRTCRRAVLMMIWGWEQINVILKNNGRIFLPAEFSFWGPPPPQILARQLQDTEAALVAEREESNTSKKHAEQLKEELKEVRKELESVVLICGQVQQKNREQEVKPRWE